MLPFSAEEAATAIRNAKNPNSALKNFLKHEVRPGDPSVRFIKGLRDAAYAKNPLVLQNQIEAGLENFNMHILVVLRYAYNEQMSDIAEQTVNKYADSFNSTYERSGEDIKVKDNASFRKQFDEVLSFFEKALAEKQLPVNGLMKNVLIAFVFEPAVIKEYFRQ